MDLPTPWPPALREPRRVRRYGELVAFSCRADDGPRLAIAAVSERAERRLARAADAHARIDSPHVPRVVSHERQLLVLDCDAVTDLEVLSDAALASGIKAPYPAAIAFNEFLIDALEAIHHARGGPACLGGLGARNVVIGASGRTWLLGAGENYPLRQDDGRFVNASLASVAPEVILGLPATTVSDVYALQGILPPLLAHVDIFPAFEAAARGGATAELAELRAALVAVQRDALAPDPSARIDSITELRRRYREIRALLPSLPDPDFDGITTFLASVVEALQDPADGGDATADVRVDRTRRVVHVGDEEVDLSRRGPLWRVWDRLADARVSAEPAVPLQALVEAGWPGEQVLPDAARARVHVALSTLRKLGLRELLVRRGEGYAIAPEATVHITE